MVAGANGGFKPCEANAAHALLYCPQFSRKIIYDVRRQSLVATDDTPAGPKGAWTDSHTNALAIWLQNKIIPVNPKHVASALSGVIIHGYTVDPLADYLNGLAWDGQERIATWLADYCAAERSPANSVMGSKFLIGMVARALRPGCKMDNMLLFEGVQGKRKSSMIKVLGGEWVAEHIPDFKGKDSQLIACTNWIVEVSEMAAFHKTNIGDLKSFISRQEHPLRLPYGKLPVKLPCWCVFIGNYNPDGTGALDDPTGGRRFWPVTVGMIDLDALTKDRDQLFAEAVHCFTRGDTWWIDNEEDQTFVAEQQERRRDVDDWLPDIERYVTRDYTTGELLPSYLDPVTTRQVLEHAIKMVSKDIAKAHQMRAAKCLKELGYSRSKLWGKDGSSRIYTRIKEG